MIRQRLLTCGLSILALTTACAEPTGVGTMTADIVFEGQSGVSKQALRAAALPANIGRLQISALDVDGSTLATTVLALEPRDGELILSPEGGMWTLDAVPAGTGRVISARAFFSSAVAGGADDVVAFRGRIENIEVKVGTLTEAGILTLRQVKRIPSADFDAPGRPQVTALPLPEGQALGITFTAPDDPDLVGYLLAVATSSAANLPPAIPRGTQVAEQDILADGVRVYQMWTLDSTQIVQVTGLQDAVPVGIFIYAYDTDAAGNPLNFSVPGQALAVPNDSLAPGAPVDLSAQLTTAEFVQISMTAPGEDGPAGGAPAAYELRASTDPGPLSDPSQFAALPALAPPPVAAPGSSVVFDRSLSELGVPANTPFYVGLRAIDAAANVGMSAVTMVVLNATLAPSLTAISPPIALAGREIEITGAGFGTVTGTVTLQASETASTAVTLNVSRWTATQIIATVPPEARTGRLQVHPIDGSSASAPLSVVANIPNQVRDEEFPFELIGTGAENPPVAALYREEGEDGPVNAAVERLFGVVNEGVPLGPQVETRRSTSIAGTYSPAHDRFLFIASNQNLSMTSVLVTSSTITPDQFRLPVAVTAGQADRVSVVIMDGGVAGAVPAMVAFTLNGAIRTATVGDARFQPFDGFFATTSTVQQYERVTIASKDDGAVLMAYRTVTGTTAVLSLSDNALGLGPNRFNVRTPATEVAVGQRFEILAVPATPGGTQRFLVAYEALQPDGTTQVRLLWADDFGQSIGLAPMAPGDRRLDDVGLVMREGAVYIAVASTRLTGSAELTYTEVPITAIGGGPTGDGGWPGLIVDIAPSDYVARLGCKPYLQATCPIVWLGDDAGLLFVRR